MPRADDLFARLGLDPQDPAVRHALLELAFGPGGIARAGTPSRPDPRIEVAPPPQAPLLLTVKVALDEAKPPIWRRRRRRSGRLLRPYAECRRPPSGAPGAASDLPLSIGSSPSKELT